MADAIHLRIAREQDAEAIRILTREAYAKWVAATGRNGGVAVHMSKACATRP